MLVEPKNSKGSADVIKYDFFSSED